MATMTSVREIADSYFAAWNAHDPDAVAAHFSPDGVRHWRVVNNPAIHSPERFEGPEAIAGGVKGFMDMIPDLQKRARDQSITDAEKEIRLEQERETARLIEARRHPDSLTQEERFARVRGVGEKTVEQLKMAGYGTPEAVNAEPDMNKLADSSGLGIKKARQIKHAVGVYLEEEAKLRADLDAEKLRAPKAEGPLA